MKVALVHHSLNIPGGAERLCLTTIEALKKKGYNVTLVTVEKTNWDLVRRNFGEIVSPDKESYLTSFTLSKHLSNMLGASLYFISYVLQLLQKKARRKYDLVINTFGDIVSSLANITYVHFPLRAAVEFSQVPAFSSPLKWRAVASYYYMALAVLDRISPGTLLTNSKFVQKIIRDVLGRRSLVVYPPVDVESFSTQYLQKQQKDSIVATISSFTPKRHLERIPIIAKQTKSANFVILGKANQYSSLVLTKLEEQIRSLGVENKVELKINVSSKELRETLARAKVYLHVMPSEHFGISVVEAMASGCIPVVNRSGGPWLDIMSAQQGECGFAYSSAKEAAVFIDALVGDEKLRSEIAPKAFYRAKAFDKSVFMRNMVKVVEKVAN